MCGIAAIFSSSGLPAKWLSKMNQVIRHRGPDDEGYVVFNKNRKRIVAGGQDTPSDVYKDEIPWKPNSNHLEDQCITVGLGHRRLAILDLSSHGHQPMCDKTQRYWITYNGEIYNYLEVREKLEKEGYQFITGTDTEVILQAYCAWGIECLHFFNGMFAFVLYDSIENTFFAVRDRFAVKPLYYWQSPEGFLAIASEIKQLMQLLGWKATLNGQRAFDYLQWNITDHTDETLFSGVHQLPGGHYLHGNLENVKVHQWYELPVHPQVISFQDAANQFKKLLEDSVRLRLRADVPVGSCLSGGLDSSSIVCLMNKLLKQQNQLEQQLTFSACSHHKCFDESHFAKLVVDETGVLAKYLFPELDDLIKQLDDLIWYHDEPFGSTSIFAQWEVFKHAKNAGVTVMLDGQGADEQLAGYCNFFQVYLLELFHRKNMRSLWREICSYKHIQGIKHPSLMLLKALIPNSTKQRLRSLMGYSSGDYSWIDTDKLQVKNFDPHLGRYPGDGALNQMSYAQVTKMNLPMLLRYEDRNSMAHSIESRTPFVDYRLVEFLQGIPASFKLSEGMTKKILRESMKGVLPEGVRQRVDKLGFATPEEIWIKKQQPNFFRKLVKESVEQSRGIINERAIQMTEEIIQGKREFSFFIWRVINFGKWMERYIN